MCDRYSLSHGYICNDCFEELVATRNTDIETFMTNGKRSSAPEIDWHAYFDAEFPDVRD